MPLTSIHNFPQEILELFPVHVDRATLPALRLVSKEMNELAGAKLFETLYVDLRRSANPQIVHQLENAASGKGPNVRWTRTLSVKHLLADDPEDDAELDDLPVPSIMQYYRLLVCQRTTLVPAILAMKNVGAAQIYGVGERGMRHLGILDAIARLPKLQDIHVNCDPYLSTPLPALSNLRSLHNFSLFITRLSPSLADAIRGLINQSPALSKLEILQGSNLGYQDSEPLAINPIVDFDQFLPSPPPSTPALAQLTLTKDRVRLTAASVPFLKSLTRLILRESALMAEPAFWAALEQSGVALHTLSAYPLSPAVIKYLLSFSGLVNLYVLADPHQLAHYAADASAQYHEECFQFVLPHHRLTMEIAATGPRHHNSWSMTEDFLNRALLCTSLKELSVTVHIPSKSGELEVESGLPPTNSPLISMDFLLKGVAKGLPNLQSLTIYPSLSFLQNRGRDRWGYLQFTAQTEILELIESVDLSDYVDRCNFKVDANRGSFAFTTLNFDRGMGRFVAPKLKPKAPKEWTVNRDGYSMTFIAVTDE